MIRKHTETVRQTLIAAPDEALVDSTRGAGAVRATLPVDESSNAALRALRDEVLGDLYGEILQPG